MPDFSRFLVYLAVMAGVTYLVRMLPLILVRRKFENKFILSFLYYVPYSVLATMTVPAVFYSTGNIVSAVLGFTVALAVAFFEKSLVTVAASACGAVLLCELILRLL